MKKITLVLIVSFMFSATVSLSQKSINFGLNGTAYASWIINQNTYGLPELEYDLKIGGGGAFNVTCNFNNNLSLQLEFDYCVRGQKYDGFQNKIPATRDITLTYYEIPILLKYMGKGSKTRFRFLAGPYFGILKAAEHEYLVNGKVPNTYVKPDGLDSALVATTDVLDRYEENDIGIILDVGADLILSDNWFMTIALRFNYGFNDINVSAWRFPNLNGQYEPSNNFSGGLIFGINYKIPFKKKEKGVPLSN